MSFFNKVIILGTCFLSIAFANAKEACKKTITVAIIDTGIDLNHKDILDHLWSDPGRPGVYGFDFTKNTYNPKDVNGHGTHVAGLILSQTPCVKLMPILYYKDSDVGPANLTREIEAIYYAINNKADIINYSGGGPKFDENEFIAVSEAKKKGIIFVTAAGNEKEDIDASVKDKYSFVNSKENKDDDDTKYFPASYELNNIFPVSAVGSDDTLIEKSNWGKKTVDVATQGLNLRSYFLNGATQKMSGTSMSTALVSGYIAKILSEGKKLSFSQVRALLYKKTRKVAGLKDKIRSGGVLDLYSERKISSTNF